VRALSLTATALSATAIAWAVNTAPAMACGTGEEETPWAVDASKLTEPIQKEVTENLPTILGFVGLIFAIGFIIGWILIRARTAKR